MDLNNLVRLLNTHGFDEYESASKELKMLLSESMCDNIQNIVSFICDHPNNDSCVLACYLSSPFSQNNVLMEKLIHLECFEDIFIRFFQIVRFGTESISKLISGFIEKIVVYMLKKGSSDIFDDIWYAMCGREKCDSINRIILLATNILMSTKMSFDVCLNDYVTLLLEAIQCYDDKNAFWQLLSVIIKNNKMNKELGSIIETVFIEIKPYGVTPGSCILWKQIIKHSQLDKDSILELIHQSLGFINHYDVLCVLCQLIRQASNYEYTINELFMDQFWDYMFQCHDIDFNIAIFKSLCKFFELSKHYLLIEQAFGFLNNGMKYQRVLSSQYLKYGFKFFDLLLSEDMILSIIEQMYTNDTDILVIFFQIIRILIQRSYEGLVNLSFVEYIINIDGFVNIYYNYHEELHQPVLKLFESLVNYGTSELSDKTRNVLLGILEYTSNYTQYNIYDSVSRIISRIPDPIPFVTTVINKYDEYLESNNIWMQLIAMNTILSIICARKNQLTDHFDRFVYLFLRTYHEGGNYSENAILPLSVLCKNSPETMTRYIQEFKEILNHGLVLYDQLYELLSSVILLDVLIVYHLLSIEEYSEYIPFLLHILDKDHDCKNLDSSVLLCLSHCELGSFIETLHEYVCIYIDYIDDLKCEEKSDLIGALISCCLLLMKNVDYDVFEWIEYLIGVSSNEDTYTGQQLDSIVELFDYMVDNCLNDALILIASYKGITRLFHNKEEQCRNIIEKAHLVEVTKSVNYVDNLH